MPAPFGPWSTSLGDELSPHLSTFWKQRLSHLASARSARAGLSRRDWLKLGAGAAAACALPTFHLASADAPPAGAGKIYITAYLNTGRGDKGWEAGLFVVDPTTNAVHRIYGFGDSVRVSRDGRTLALSRSGWTGVDHHEIDGVGLWTLDSEGKGERLQVAGFGGVVSWSPDGKQLVVSRSLSKPQDDDSRSENWRLNVDGSSPTRLPIPATDEIDDWSPDGRWFVTVSDRHPPHGSGYQIYVMHPDGTNQRRLTEGRGLNVYPRFSPDSRRIVYLHQERGKDSLWVVNIDGTGRRQVSEQENDTAPERFCWSPDGRSLACSLADWSRDKEGEQFLDPRTSNPRIAIMDEDGKSRRTLELPRAQWINSMDWR